MSEPPEGGPVHAVKINPADLVVFTQAQLRQIWDRIREIEAHFDACCAFMADKCHHNGEYQRLYDVLRLAGAPQDQVQFDPDTFEQWLASMNLAP